MKKTLRQRIARAFDWLTSERETPLSRRARNKLAKACCQDEINYGECDCAMYADQAGLAVLGAMGIFAREGAVK